MNSEPKSNWQQKLEELEVEISNTTPINKETSMNAIENIKNWFLSLPPIGKIIIGLFAISVFFSLLKTVFSLLQLLFSLAIVGVIGYFAYQFILKSNNQNNS
jgi:hypothetical protein